MDIGTEELSHLEIVGALARLHLKPLKFDRECGRSRPADRDCRRRRRQPFQFTRQSLDGGLPENHRRARRRSRSNIAAEARAKIVYERLINFTTDAGTKDALQFLMTREITHMKAFTAALDSMNKPPFMIGRFRPPSDWSISSSTRPPAREKTAKSTRADRGTRVVSSNSWKRRPSRRSPTQPLDPSADVDDRTTSTASEPELIEELLAEQLRDLLHAEGQLVKALPKMAKAARSEALKFAFEHHLEETREQQERLKEVFGLLGVPAKTKPCKGMAGLVDEGQEVMEEGQELDAAAADLALIAAAQKIEHYEISAYGTARTMAGQAGLPAAAALLNKSLAEEEVADNLLTQLARELMSEARGQTKTPKRVRATIAADEN